MNSRQSWFTGAFALTFFIIGAGVVAHAAPPGENGDKVQRSNAASALRFLANGDEATGDETQPRGSGYGVIIDDQARLHVRVPSQATQPADGAQAGDAPAEAQDDDADVGAQAKAATMRDVQLTLENEATGATLKPEPDSAEKTDDAFTTQRTFVSEGDNDATAVTVRGQWQSQDGKFIWDLELSRDAKRVGHPQKIELPLLDRSAELFTPSPMGTFSITAYPEFEMTTYRHKEMIFPLASVNRRDRGAAWTGPFRRSGTSRSFSSPGKTRAR
jgi:hypothetical protein